MSEDAGLSDRRFVVTARNNYDHSAEHNRDNPRRGCQRPPRPATPQPGNLGKSGAAQPGGNTGRAGRLEKRRSGHPGVQVGRVGQPPRKPVRRTPGCFSRRAWRSGSSLPRQTPARGGYASQPGGRNRPPVVGSWVTRQSDSGDSRSDRFGSRACR